VEVRKMQMIESLTSELVAWIAWAPVLGYVLATPDGSELYKPIGEGWVPVEATPGAADFLAAGLLDEKGTRIFEGWVELGKQAVVFDLATLRALRVQALQREIAHRRECEQVPLGAF
jgi:hypothetical protein